MGQSPTQLEMKAQGLLGVARVLSYLDGVDQRNTYLNFMPVGNGGATISEIEGTGMDLIGNLAGLQISEGVPGILGNALISKINLSAGQMILYSNQPELEIQAAKVAYTNVAATSLTASWRRGNGDGVVVFMKAASTGAPAPLNGIIYNASATFGSGTQIGSTGWYCVYKGTGTTVNITALTTATTYRIMVLEYEGTAGSEIYDNY
jgi:hypothetical protein